MLAQACDRDRVERWTHPAKLLLVGPTRLLGSLHGFLTQLTLSTAEMSQGIEQVMPFQSVRLTPLPVQFVEKSLYPPRQLPWRSARNSAHSPHSPISKTVGRKTTGGKGAVRRTRYSPLHR
jgi:hypothetical protein